MIHPVAGKLPNAFGLYDMIGNMQEWVNDLYDQYDTFTVSDPTGPDSTFSWVRIVRGGDWTSVEMLNSIQRNGIPQMTRVMDCGFRTCITEP
jgi:formylglycine-generating enzyme required for sulfatase activity